MPHMFCHVCGAQLEAGMRFCKNCGSSQPDAVGGPAPEPYVPPAMVEVRIGPWISEAWAVVKLELFPWILVALIVLFVGNAVPIILQGPLYAGVHIVALRRLRGQPIQAGAVFDGFQFFVPALIACLLMAVFIMAGALLCIIPGFVVAAMYQFTYLFIVDRRMDFWPAMQASHALVKKNYFGFTMFLLACIGINILGFLLCFVGLLVTIPIMWMAVTIAYRDLTNPPQTTTSSV